LSWSRINDNQHQYALTNAAITGDPRIYGRAYFGTNGRGIIYGDPADH
jgi:xyloglucan-specific exo-beta-1,4-glucanase